MTSSLSIKNIRSHQPERTSSILRLQNGVFTIHNIPQYSLRLRRKLLNIKLRKFYLTLMWDTWEESSSIVLKAIKTMILEFDRKKVAKIIIFAINLIKSNILKTPLHNNIEDGRSFWRVPANIKVYVTPSSCTILLHCLQQMKDCGLNVTYWLQI